MYKKLNNQYGFLLADGVIAIFIITVALIACMGVVITSHKATKVSAGHTAAIYLAQKQAEILKGSLKPADWNALPPSIEWQGNTDDLKGLNRIDYTVVTTARVCSETKRLVEVTIDVSWSDNSGNHSYQLLTAYPTI